MSTFAARYLNIIIYDFRQKRADFICLDTLTDVTHDVFLARDRRELRSRIT